MHVAPPRPLNAAQQPLGIKPGREARIPLIARLVWPDRVEYRAVHASNWSRDYVHVSWPPEQDDPHGVMGSQFWVPAADVWRILPGEMVRDEDRSDPWPAAGEAGRG